MLPVVRLQKEGPRRGRLAKLRAIRQLVTRRLEGSGEDYQQENVALGGAMDGSLPGTLGAGEDRGCLRVKYANSEI